MATSTTDQLVSKFTDTFISHDSGKKPYKLVKIFNERFQALEIVAEQIRALNDLSSLSGIQLDRYGAKWNIFRQGKTDAEMLDAITDQVYIYFSGSTISDFNSVLSALDAPSGSQIIENLPPEDAEVNVFLNGASTAVFDRISRVLDVIRGAAIEIDVFNVVSTDRLLQQTGDVLLHQDGDRILLNGATS